MRVARRGLALVGACLGSLPAWSQTYEVEWWTVDGGGASTLAGGPYVVDATAGQPDAGGPLAGGSYVIHGGFWGLAAGGPGGGQADLSLSMVDAPDPIAPGGLLTYALAAANVGPSASPSVTVTVLLPALASFVSANPGAPACTHAAGTVTCTLGPLAVSGSAAVTIQVEVAATATGSLAGTATITGPIPDPAPSNNVAQAGTAVVAVVAAEGELEHGSRFRADLAPAGSNADVDLYRIRQQPHASYEVAIDEAAGDLGVGAGPWLERVGPDGTTVLQIASPAGTGPARSLRFVNATSSVVDHQLVRVRSASCASDCGPDDVYRLRAYETTLSLARFNNGSGQVTVLILQNRDGAALSAHVHFWSAGGVLLHEESLALPARGGLALDTSTIPALAGRSGSITVAHDGAFGALGGKAVALEPATGYTFDSYLAERPR